MTAAPPRIDGRSARSARTRDAVVEAFLALIDGGNLRPTAREVSERANVSLRSVFQHFADLETLFAVAADLQVERLAALARRIPADLPFEERLAAFTDARAKLLEAITPVRRAALLQEPFSPELASRLAWARDTNRAELRALFAGEIASRPEGERAALLAALDVATNWYAWETLRRHNGLSEEDARAVLRLSIAALLGERNEETGDLKLARSARPVSSFHSPVSPKEAR